MQTLRIDPQLLEALITVELGQAERAGDRTLARAYHALTDPLYERRAPDERERAFAHVHLIWFEQRGWRDWFAWLWAGLPELGARATGLLLMGARRKQEEGAVLGRDGTGVCLRLLPNRFADRERLAVFVRHEFLHASDMLDPVFGYRVEQAETLAATNTLAERYRALWCAYADARLERRGFEPLAQVDAHCRELKQAFETFSAEQQALLFGRVRSAMALTHAELYEYARVTAKLDGAPRPGARCPLCRFPTFEWADKIAPPISHFIRADFPNWDVSLGACARCVERYELTLCPSSRSAQAV